MDPGSGVGMGHRSSKVRSGYGWVGVVRVRVGRG